MPQAAAACGLATQKNWKPSQRRIMVRRMPKPLVIAHHLVWTIYGVWLPNDPRGSGSAEVRRDNLAELGAAHLGRKAIQPTGQTICEFYKAATPLLQHPVVRLNEAARTSAAND